MQTKKMQSKKTSFRAVDLFCGGGGLTAGLKKAGFKVVAGVESNERVFSTFRRNHPDVHLITQDIREVKSTQIKKIVGNSQLDLLAGCPPCQGFSTLTAKYKKFDQRNYLINEMLRLIKDLKPRAVMMENVPGLAQRGNLLFKIFQSELEKLGYLCNWDVLQVADYGVPQSRKRLVFLAGRGFEISIPEATHGNPPDSRKKPWITLRNVIGNMPRPITLQKAHENGGPQKFNWHVVRNMSQENLLRLKFAKPGKGRQHIPRRFRPKCHKSNDKGFPNVYGRLTWDEVSSTITGGCTTLSKGRFGHPSQLRTLSVREAAILQTFPKSYKFETEFMDHACDIIGNALPVKFAKVISKACYGALNNNCN